MKWLYKLERKYGRFCIPNLMLYVVLTMLCVYAMTYIFGVPLVSYLGLSLPTLLSGQVWRLVTFIFIPPATSVIGLAFTLYFYYFVGSALENEWGSFEFNVYYLFGMVGAIIAALLSGYADNTYLNLSLFLAFAQLFPEERLMLFYLIPVKVKWLAYVDWVLFGLALVFGNWSTRAAALASLINFFIFFGPGFIQRMKQNRQYAATRKNWKRQINQNDRFRHY